jgi:hypothetical protein
MPVRVMTERTKQKSRGISLTCKRILTRLLVVINMPKDEKSERVNQESSLTFVDWLLAIDLDPLKTGADNRDE